MDDLPPDSFGAPDSLDVGGRKLEIFRLDALQFPEASRGFAQTDRPEEVRPLPAQSGEPGTESDDFERRHVAARVRFGAPNEGCTSVRAASCTTSCDSCGQAEQLGARAFGAVSLRSVWPPAGRR
jgi:hypothetical protein